MTFSYYGGAQVLALNYMVQLLQNDPYLAEVIAGRVSTTHPTLLDDPVYPSVTISRVGGSADASIEQLDSPYYYFRVFSQVGVGELYKVYDWYNADKTPAGIKALLHNKGFEYPEVTIYKMTQVSLVDDIYEQSTRTYELVARYLVRSAARTLQL